MSLEAKGSEKVPHSKISDPRLTFCNQLIKYSVSLVSLWAMINTQERTLKASLTVRSCCQLHFLILFLLGVCRSAHPSFISWYLLKNEPITLCLTNFCFHRTVWMQKDIRKNLTVSQYFRPIVKMSPKPGTTSVIVKWLMWC